VPLDIKVFWWGEATEHPVFPKNPQTKAWGYTNQARLRGLREIAQALGFARVAIPF